MSVPWIARVVLTGLLVAGVSACAPSEEAGATRPEVRPVTLPDLSRLSESVRDQVRERHTALTGIDRPETPADELGRAHGDLGLVLMAADYDTAALSSLRNAQVVAPHDPRWPYACRTFDIKSRALPSIEVERSSGHPCRAFEARSPAREPGAPPKRLR